MTWIHVQTHRKLKCHEYTRDSISVLQKLKTLNVNVRPSLGHAVLRLQGRKAKPPQCNLLTSNLGTALPRSI